MVERQNRIGIGLDDQNRVIVRSTWSLGYHNFYHEADSICQVDICLGNVEILHTSVLNIIGLLY